MNTAAKTLPNLVVSRRVIDRMAAAARRYGRDETGEALVGLVEPGANTNGVPTLYVLDTIAPDESAVRAAHTFQQGDEHQDEMMWWMQANWRAFAKGTKWEGALVYLGDWHKQPGFMIAPSGGDLMTALDWLDDEENGMDFLLTPIVTLGHPATTAFDGATANFVTVPHSDGSNVRIDFWYIDRVGRKFAPLAPAIYPAAQLPQLPPAPWHLANSGRFESEHRQLEADGLFVSLILWDALGEPPLEVCFLTLRVGGGRALILITPWDYPERPPQARAAPYVPFAPGGDIYAVFEQMWEQSEPIVEPVGWRWTPEKYLVDYIHAVEAAPAAAQSRVNAAELDNDLPERELPMPPYGDTPKR